jgi:hypothetical protein
MEQQERQAEFDIPSLKHERQGLDLCNSLTAITGVSHIDFDEDQHKIWVRYDPDLVSPVMLANSIKGTGYPLADHHSRRQ